MIVGGWSYEASWMIASFTSIFMPPSRPRRRAEIGGASRNGTINTTRVIDYYTYIPEGDTYPPAVMWLLCTHIKSLYVQLVHCVCVYNNNRAGDL